MDKDEDGFITAPGGPLGQPAWATNHNMEIRAHIAEGELLMARAERWQQKHKREQATGTLTKEEALRKIDEAIAEVMKANEKLNAVICSTDIDILMDIRYAVADRMAVMRRRLMRSC